MRILLGSFRINSVIAMMNIIGWTSDKIPRGFGGVLQSKTATVKNY